MHPIRLIVSVAYKPADVIFVVREKYYIITDKYGRYKRKGCKLTRLLFSIFYGKSGPGGNMEVQVEVDAINCCGSFFVPY